MVKRAIITYAPRAMRAVAELSVAGIPVPNVPPVMALADAGAAHSAAGGGECDTRADRPFDMTPTA